MNLGPFEEQPTDKQVDAAATTMRTQTTRTIKMVGITRAGTSTKMDTMATTVGMGIMTMGTTKVVTLMAAASAVLRKIPRLSATSP